MSSSGVMRLALAIAVAGILLATLLPAARAPPLVPYEAWGLAKNSAGASLGVNQPIRTFIDGVDYSNLTSTYRADGSYQTQIAGNWYIGPSSETPMLKEGGDPNDPVMFAHADMTTTGIVFQETAAWVTAGFQNLDLTEGVSANQPALLKIQTVTTRPADTLSQYAYICNPTAAPVDLSKYYFQKDVPGSFAGPQVALAGTVGANQKIFGDMRSTSYLTNNGDVLKLVYDNTPGVGSPNGGGDIVVDRVEFNASVSGALTWEPGNTIMSDAAAPGLGQEIHRTASCTDTNQGSDFTVGTETGRPTAPSVVVTSPNGGQRWTGGTPHAITFTLFDAQDAAIVLSVNITYSTNSGTSYGNLILGPTTGFPASASYNWNPIPTIDTTTARVLVCARDTTNLLGCDASDNDFTIDSTNPTVTARNPGPGATGVPVNQNILVTFSELMDQPSVASAFSLSPGAGILGYTWSSTQVTVTHSAPFQQGQTYSVTIGTGARDTSNPALNLIPSVTWSFTAFQNNAPTVTITAPTGTNLCWSGGFPHRVSWLMNDVETPPAQLIAYVNYTSTPSSGAIAGPLTGATSFDWTPSGLNALDVRIQVTVIDGGGASSTDQTLQFQVDSTAPTILTTTPLNAATRVLRSQAVIIQFSEGMDQASVRNGVAFLPAVANPVFSWSGNTVTITHDPFAAATVYTVTLNNVHDDCDPGFALTGTTSFTFTTAAPPIAAITAPTAGAQFTGGQSISITWTMSDADTLPQNLVVYLNYTTGAGEIAIAGPLSAFTSGSGSYSWTAPGIDSSNVQVVLTVIDELGQSDRKVSQPFSIKPGSGLDLVVVGGALALILIIVVAALLYFLVFAKRRKKEEAAPPVAPARTAPPRAPAARAPSAPPPPATAPSGATRECPSCGTIVDAKDPECFMCGHKF
ncbi:MAG: hypothetical protein E6K10_05330 [Methanobacteriota archaeon]|nr:MAG: hypothetical protein E6K10_05330 [Euryarchaeota archaeon]